MSKMTERERDIWSQGYSACLRDCALVLSGFLEGLAELGMCSPSGPQMAQTSAKQSDNRGVVTK